MLRTSSDNPAAAANEPDRYGAFDQVAGANRPDREIFQNTPESNA